MRKVLDVIEMQHRFLIFIREMKSTVDGVLTCPLLSISPLCLILLLHLTLQMLNAKAKLGHRTPWCCWHTRPSYRSQSSPTRRAILSFAYPPLSDQDPISCKSPLDRDTLSSRATINTQDFQQMLPRIQVAQQRSGISSMCRRMHC